MRKTRWQTYYDRQEGALAGARERNERNAFPDRIALFFGDETGISNGAGWRLQGAIEDEAAALRLQSFEETVFCMGRHGGIGMNDDDALVFPRKFGAEALRGGWRHWSQKAISGMPDLLRAHGEGDQLRADAELIEKWLEADRTLSDEKAALIRGDVAPLILPSWE
ncbi:hypothetical protein [Rubrimonas cliftonensis]|uniref:Uncharacterized protein n=1 Tax=Rubrimonas cliftonensis TaxID=89524 RepID=A0A1H4FUG4_9RHOB|nr:hypothetical protein [Rubrimonas cliftonensis]SEB00924.1 hypothetical protein SAMN05444370_1296 [Rubrimonas cliftonensis]